MTLALKLFIEKKKIENVAQKSIATSINVIIIVIISKKYSDKIAIKIFAKPKNFCFF